MRTGDFGRGIRQVWEAESFAHKRNRRGWDSGCPRRCASIRARLESRLWDGQWPGAGLSVAAAEKAHDHEISTPQNRRRVSARGSDQQRAIEAARIPLSAGQERICVGRESQNLCLQFLTEGYSPPASTPSLTDMGCFLIYTDEDLDKTEVITSLDEAFERLAEEPKGFTEALADEKNPNHQLAMSAALRGVSADLPASYKEAFIESLKDICRVEPTVVGLVHNYSYRAPQDRIGRDQHQTVVLNTEIKAERAAEVITAGALVKNVSFPASNGKTEGLLHFNSVTDRIDFSQKFQTNDLERKRGSIEADFKIIRDIVSLPGIIVDTKTIGVDVKHAKSGKYSSVKEGQLTAVVKSLLNGEVDEFHFATKGLFTPGVKKLVDEANALYWSLAKNEDLLTDGDGGLRNLQDEAQMGKEELAAYREAQAEIAEMPPRIFMNEGVWMPGFK